MADINIDPILTDPLSIQLYGNTYKLTEPVGVVMSSVFPPKLVIGDYQAEDNQFVSTYTVSDLRGGPGLWTYRNPAQDLNRYWRSVTLSGSGIGVITSLWANAITGAAIAINVYDTPNTGGSTAIPQWIFNVGSNVVYTNADARVYSSTGAAVDTLPGAVVAPPTIFRFYDSANAAYRNRVFYACGTGYSYHDDVTSTATDVSASSTNPDMIASVVWDKRIWALDVNRVLWQSNTGDDGSWTQMALLPDEAAGTTYYRLIVYDDPNGSPVIWAITNSGPYLYDAVNDTWLQSRFCHHRYSPATVLGNQFAAVFHDSLFIISGDQKIEKLTMEAGQLIVESVYPGDPDGSYTSDLVIRSISADSNRLYIAMSNGVGSSDNYTTKFLAYTDLGWSEIAGRSHTAAGSNYTFGTMSIVTNATYNDLFTGFHLGAAVDLGEVDNYSLANLDRSPVLAGSTTLAAVALELPVFDAYYPSQQKTALKCRVMMAGTAGTGTITPYYRLEGSTGAWTALTAVTNTGSENVIYFGTNRGGIAFKQIQFRLEFTGTSPQLVSFTMEYLRIPEILRGFIVNIDCTAPYGNRTQATMINDIWTAISTNTLGTFTYRDTSADANGSERAYLVKVMRPEGLEWTGYDERGVYKLFLVELNDHPSS